MEERIEKNWQFPQLLRTDVLPTTPTLILTPTGGTPTGGTPPKKITISGEHQCSVDQACRKVFGA